MDCKIMLQMETDRNLLFGILALQMDFVTRDDLITGMNSWILEKNRTLGEILVKRGSVGRRSLPARTSGPAAHRAARR